MVEVFDPVLAESGIQQHLSLLPTATCRPLRLRLAPSEHSVLYLRNLWPCCCSRDCTLSAGFPSAVFVVMVAYSRVTPVLIQWSIHFTACSHHAGTSATNFSPCGSGPGSGHRAVGFPRRNNSRTISARSGGLPLWQGTPLRTVCAARGNTGCQLGHHNVRPG